MLVKNISREGRQRVTGMGDQFWFGLGATSVTDHVIVQRYCRPSIQLGRRGK
jgi:hypothetical protein